MAGGGFCGGEACDLDADGDTFSQFNDCQDSDLFAECQTPNPAGSRCSKNVHPGAVDVPGDGIDNDCNGFIDTLPLFTCSITDNLCNPLLDYGCLDGEICRLKALIEPNVDSDGDGQTTAAGDCNDTNANVHTGAREDCDNIIDESHNLTYRLNSYHVFRHWFYHDVNEGGSYDILIYFVYSNTLVAHNRQRDNILISRYTDGAPFTMADIA